MGYAVSVYPSEPASAPTLDDLADNPLWVVWRNDRTETGSLRKTPYTPTGSRAAAGKPDTWATRERAEKAAKRLVNGTGGGIGLMFDALPDNPELWLGGVDLDTCRDAWMTINLV